MAPERRHLIFASDLPGRTVVSLRSGDALAEIRHAIIDPSTHELTGLLVERGRDGGSPAEVRADRIHAIGPAAVMVASETDLEPSDQRPESDATVDVVGGIRLCTERGEELGPVDDVVLDAGAHPTTVAYRIHTAAGQRLIPRTGHAIVSSDEVRVRVDVDHESLTDLDRLTVALDRLQSSADPRRHEPATAPHEDAIRPALDVDPRGRVVLDTRGHALGQVSDVHLDQDGLITAVTTAEGRIPRSRIRASGHHALVVEATT